MAIYTSRHTGEQIDEAVSKSLATEIDTTTIPVNGQVLTWEDTAYTPQNVQIPQLYASNILIDRPTSPNPTLENDEPLCNIIPILEDKLSKTNAADAIEFSVQWVEDSSLSPRVNMSLSTFANKVYTRLVSGGYTEIGNPITNLSTTQSVEFAQFPQKLLIYFENLSGSDTHTVLLAGVNSNKLIPVLSCANGTSYYGYIEITNIGYSWKFEVVAYNGSPSSYNNTSYISATPTTYIYTEDISGANGLYLAAGSSGVGARDSITGTIRLYKYIK